MRIKELIQDKLSIYYKVSTQKTLARITITIAIVVTAFMQMKQFHEAKWLGQGHSGFWWERVGTELYVCQSGTIPPYIMQHTLIAT